MPQGLSNIRNLSLKELQGEFVERNEKSFRAKQVYEWLWKKNAASFYECRILYHKLMIINSM